MESVNGVGSQTRRAGLWLGCGRRTVTDGERVVG